MQIKFPEYNAELELMEEILESVSLPQPSQLKRFLHNLLKIEHSIDTALKKKILKKPVFI